MYIIKSVITLVLLALCTSVYGQLFVKPTATDASYVYVEGTYLFVEEDVTLVSNSTSSEPGYPSIALRQGSQLLQRGTGIPPLNSGTGQLSVFQEGTSDAYAYNYWSSPVGLSNPSNSAQVGRFKAGPSANETVLFVPSTVLESNITLETPSLQGTSVTGSAFISKYWLWRKPGGTNYASWQHVSNSGTVAPGYGFTMKGVDGSDAFTFAGEGTPNNTGAAFGAAGQGQRYDFRGIPNNGNHNITVGGAGDEILVGNPYPSAFDLSYFLMENSGSGASHHVVELQLQEQIKLQESPISGIVTLLYVHIIFQNMKEVTGHLCLEYYAMTLELISQRYLQHMMIMEML